MSRVHVCRLIHHATVAQCEQLEEVFAYLTPNGWVIPSWLILMKAMAKA